MSFTADFAASTYVAPKFRASGLTFAQFQAAGLSGLLEAMIAAQTAIGAPGSAPTGVASGTDGSLPVGVYKAVVTWTAGYGETVASAESSGVTVGSTNHIVWTIPSLNSGANGANLYMTAAGGAAGSETLYATGITGTTYTAASATWAGTAVPPAADTTLIGGAVLHKLRTVENRLGWQAWERVSNEMSAWLRGDPIAFDEMRANGLAMEAVFRGWVQALSEMNTLLAANPGQMTTASIGPPNLYGNKRVFA